MTKDNLTERRSPTSTSFDGRFLYGENERLNNVIAQQQALLEDAEKLIRTMRGCLESPSSSFLLEIDSLLIRLRADHG